MNNALFNASDDLIGADMPGRQIRGGAMNIYGTKGKMIRGEVLESLNCPSCGNKTHRSFGVLRYFHLYGISVFPITKKVGIECINCRWTLLDRQIPENIRREISETIFERKRLLPIFAG